MSFDAGDTGTIRYRASSAENLASRIAGQVNGVRQLLPTAATIGSNAYTNAATNEILDIVIRLDALSKAVARIASVLFSLAKTLEEIELQARTDVYLGANTHASGTLAFAMRDYAADANRARSVANAQIRAIRESMPNYHNYTQEAFDSYFSETGRVVAREAANSVEGAVALGRFVVWDGTLRALVDPRGAGEAWGQVGEGLRSAASDPVDTVFDTKLFNENAAAWGFVMIGTVLSGGSGKGLRIVRLVDHGQAVKHIPGKSLIVHEGRVTPGRRDAAGHVIQRHVGLDDSALKSRAQAEHLPRTSSFPDEKTAERAIGGALEHNSEQIQSWLAGRQPNLSIDASFSDVIGRTYDSLNDSFTDARSVRAFLLRDSTIDGGFRIVTVKIY